MVDSGNLVVNGGSVYSEVYYTANYSSAAYQVAGDILVTGGTVEAYSANNSGLRASNITVSGGKVIANAEMGALVVKSDTGVITVTGGTVEGTATRPFAYNNTATSQAVSVPVLGTGAVVTAGASKDTAAVVADAESFAFNTKYIKVDYTAPAPTDGTSAPTSGTTPGQTSAPTSGTTPSATTIPTGPALTEAYAVKIDGLELKVTKYDDPVYSMNATKTGYFNTVSNGAVTDSVAKDYAGQTKTGADESNYNAKLIWHAGDAAPTLYLKNLIVDNYDEDLKKWRYPSAGNKNYVSNAAIYTGSTAPLKIVVEGGESKFQTINGIHYQKDLTIESKGDAKLTLWTSRNGILPTKVADGYANNNTHLSGSKLTLNANLTVSLGGFSNFDNSGYIIRTKGADMIINGGNIITEFRESVARGVQAIGVVDSGNLYVNAGYIYGASYDTINMTSAAYQVAGDIIVTGGTLEAESANQSGIRATNITVSGGKVVVNAGTGGLVINNTTGAITVTGGIVEAKADKPFAYNNAEKSQAIKIPTLGAVMPVVKAGSALKTADYIDDVANFKFDERYIHLDYVVDPNAPRPTVDPNAPTEPIEPGSELDDALTIGLGTGSLKITHYDTPVYSINSAVETEDTEGNKMTRYFQTKTGANEENYNAKFVWNSTDPTPTLILRGFKMDDWNNEKELWAVNPNNTGKGYFQTYSITTDKKAPLTILLTGEDSMIECYFGITYHSDLTIKSEGATKLTIYGQASAISPNTTAGSTLTIDANLVLSVRSLYNTEFSAGCIMNYDGDIIINGGTIKCTPLDVYGKNYSLQAIYARKGGNITINGGNITGSSTGGAGHKNGAIQTQEKLTINGGTVNVNPKKAVALYGGQGIEVNGGVVNVIGPWYAITSGTDKEGTPIVFNGGTTTIMAERCFYTGSVLKFGEGVMAYCGAGPKNAEVYDGSDTKLALKPWFLITNDPDKFIEIDEEEEDPDLPIFTLPTKAPTQATEAPTDATAAPTDATVAPTDATVAPDATQAPDATEAPDATVAPEEEPNTKIELVEGEMAEISQELIDLGLDSTEKILQSMLESIWAVDENINRVSFFDAVLMYREGDEWIKADETHFPEDGWLQVLLPYPEGTDMNTQFTGLHMFTSSAFGKTPGDVELLLAECTEEGILVEVTGLSPILLGWVADGSEDVDPDQGETPDEPKNPETGDTGVAMLVALMLVAALGIVAVVIVNKKRTYNIR